MMGPAALLTLGLIALPLLFAVYMAVHTFSLKSITGGRFIGLENLGRAYGDPAFRSAALVTIWLFVVSLAVEVVLGTYLGLLLGRQLRGMRLLRVLALFPSVVPSVAAGMMWLLMYDPTLGLLNYLLGLVHAGPSLWLAGPSTVLPSLALVDVWQWTPFIAIIVVGGIQAVPEEPYEAARIDGASNFDILRYITLPLLRPTIVVAAMLRSVDLLRIFDTIYVMTQGGPGNASASLNIFAYQQGFLYANQGYASALMLLLLGLVAVVTLGLSRARRIAG
ncbi:MAG: carbohydrate ABC transporter permease [Chloroflexota bacterium]